MRVQLKKEGKKEQREKPRELQYNRRQDKRCAGFTCEKNSYRGLRGSVEHD